MPDIANVRDRNIAKAFSYLDVNEDGFLSEDDVITLGERVCARFSLREGEQRAAIMSAIQNWWRQLDEDCPSGDGRISMDDFAKATVTGRGDPLEHFRKGLGGVSVVMAKSIDRDGDGLIELDEYVNWFSVVPVPRDIVVAAFERLDTDGDGHITHAEFIEGTQQLMLSQDAHDPGTVMLGHD